MQKRIIIFLAMLFCRPVNAKGVFTQLVANEGGGIPQQTSRPGLRQDCALVTHFVTYNGGYFLKYEAAVEIRKSAGLVLAKTSNLAARYQVAQDAKDALEIMNEVEPKMIHIPASPEEWTVEDLRKLKTDPKGKKVFVALVRVRNAIYDPTIDANLRKELARALLDHIPDRKTDALKELFDRVQMAEGR